MIHADVYELSRKFGPPKYDLRAGWIVDNWGSEAGATLFLDHKSPEDVRREHFEFYHDVFNYLEPTDLLFYLYPIAKVFTEGGLNGIDWFLYCVNEEFENLKQVLSPSEQDALLNGLRWIYDNDASDQGDWSELMRIKGALGLPFRELPNG